MAVGERSLVVLIAAALVTTACATIPSRVSAGAAITAGPTVGGCQVFPSTNAWNKPITNSAVLGNSTAIVSKISSTGGRSFLHADFGGGGAYGIPFKLVTSEQPKVPIVYTAYGDESDKGPFPIPSNAPIEGGPSSTGDRHVIVVQEGYCHLYELYDAYWKTNHWEAASGATWNLASNALRPAGWTSADAAGLPILPGLVRYDEVAAGHINHALRFTVAKTQKGYISPARHYASSSTDPTLPPMGMRFRLKASFNLAPYHGEALVILKALRTYGMIVADNGSSWFITGASDKRWNDTDLDQLKKVPGSAFEAVYTGAIQH
jgi:hypothetical protein